MSDKRITDLRKAFNIPDHYNEGFLGILIYSPYMPKTYYLNAIAYFNDIPLKHITLFTDNLKKAKDVFASFYPIGNSKSAIDEFMKICWCQHLIIDKSDYSGLVGYLNTHPDRIIIQPK
jgi:hypothetical protein